MIRQLFLSRTLLACVEFECVKAAGVETGGIFVAYIEKGTVFPVLASGPGPRSELARDSFGWDSEYIAEWLFTAGRAASRVAERDGGDWTVGRWHKHTLPIVNPSDQDREGALALSDAFHQKSIVDLIVACDGNDVSLHYGAFLFERKPATYRPIPAIRTLPA